MRIELNGEIEQVILSRFESGQYESLEEVIAEAFLPDVLRSSERTHKHNILTENDSEPRTAVCELLDKARTDFVASGGKLLDENEISRLRQQRRGGLPWTD